MGVTANTISASLPTEASGQQHQRRILLCREGSGVELSMSTTRGSEQGVMEAGAGCKICCCADALILSFPHSGDERATRTAAD